MKNCGFEDGALLPCFMLLCENVIYIYRILGVGELILFLRSNFSLIIRHYELVFY